MSLSLQTFCTFPRAVAASNNILLISLVESFDGEVSLLGTLID